MPPPPGLPRKGKDMKRLLRWLVKKFIGKDEIKGAIRALNESLAGIEVPEAAAKVLSVSESAADILNAYLSGFAGDGRIDGDELAAINAATDAAVDKYLTDAAVEAALDKILG